ncbi:O-antigen ligase family protein [Oceanobacillus kimchii]|uniref:O-antigen ligase family protein n=1 Tax=Oceanobacillus kimchii TaxID=746691 RepID=UPI003B02CDEA
MINNNLNSSNIILSTNIFYKFILLLYLSMLYAFFDEYKNIIQIIFSITFLFYFLTRRKKLTVFFLWNFIFIIWCFLSIFWSSNTEQTLIETRIMIEIAIVSNLFIVYVDNKEKLITVYKFLVIAGIIYVFRLLFEFPLSTWLEGRLGSEGQFNPNRIGLYLTISAIFSFYLAQTRHKFYYMLFIVFGLVVSLTGSRKAFLMLLLGILLLYYLNKGKNLTKKILAIPILIGILIIGLFIVYNVPILYEILGSRLDSLITVFTNTGVGDNSINERSQMIEIGRMLFLDKPFFGYGLGSYGLESGLGEYSHNNYIELLVGLGIIGLLIYYSMFIFIMIKLYIVRDRILSNPIFVILFLLLIMDYGLVSYNGFLYQFIIALGFIALRITKYFNQPKL